MIREKKHRLPREFYKGETSVAFTLCVKGNIQPFLKPETVSKFIEILASIISVENCIVPVYCFMPDHLHLIVTGEQSNSDIWNTILNYKQRTGFWFSKNEPALKWQKDFYDHVLKTNKEIITQVRYILDNPVRKGIVTSWEEYPFKGSIGCTLNNILNGIL